MKSEMKSDQPDPCEHKFKPAKYFKGYDTCENCCVFRRNKKHPKFKKRRDEK